MTGQTQGEQLRSFQQRKYGRYCDVLKNDSRPVEQRRIGWFDRIVVTSADEAQTLAFEQSIRQLKAQKRVPKNCEYDVIPDPPGPKVGCGGATLHVLKILRGRVGIEKLCSERIMLIHAGGYSKRIPNHSACGKIFASLPMGLNGRSCSMMELKCIMLVDIPRLMKRPGVFLTASDDIELFEFDTPIDQPGFVAFGHPSSLQIGTGHGVFVLDNEDLRRENSANSMLPCQKFLHKPTVQEMQDGNALVGNYLQAQLSAEDRVSPEDAQVLTDSAFLFDEGVVRRLLEFADEYGELDCEVDAYGDFLRPCGPGADRAYIGDFRNVGTGVASETDRLRRARTMLFEGLKGTKLTCIPLIPSKFYHFGTIEEFLHHCCADLNFASELPITRLIGNSLALGVKVAHDSCLLHCFARPEVEVEGGCAIEFCQLERGVSVGPRCLLSGVVVPKATKVPPDTFAMTVPLNRHSESLDLDGLSMPDVIYATFVCSTLDDLKKPATGSEAGLQSMDLLGWTLPWNRVNDVRSVLRLISGAPAERPWASSVGKDPKARSLWNLRMFPVAASPNASAELAFQLLRIQQAVLDPSAGQESAKKSASRLQAEALGWVALSQCVLAKAPQEQIALRERLETDISRGQGRAGND